MRYTRSIGMTVAVLAGCLFTMPGQAQNSKPAKKQKATPMLRQKSTSMQAEPMMNSPRMSQSGAMMAANFKQQIDKSTGDVDAISKLLDSIEARKAAYRAEHPSAGSGQ